MWANVPGRLRHHAASTAELPAVGDWVAYDLRPAQSGGRRPGRPAAPVGVLPQARPDFETAEQVVAANVDVALPRRPRSTRI